MNTHLKHLVLPEHDLATMVSKYPSFISILAKCCLILIAFGCASDASTYSNIQLAETSDQILKVSDIITERTWIQLDSVSDAIIGSVSRIIEYNDNYYILDSKSKRKVIVFDKNGNFLNCIGNIGSGEGEYNDVLDFTVNTSTGEVIVLSNASQVYVYDKDGHFLKRKKLTDSLIWHLVYSGGQYIGSTDNCTYLEGDHAFLLYTFDRDFNETGKYFPVLQKQMPSSIMFDGMLTTQSDVCYYIDMFSNTLYEIRDNHEPTILHKFSLPDPMPLSDFAGGMNFFLQQTNHDWIKSFVPLRDSFIITYVINGKLHLANISYKGELNSSGVVGGVLPKMFATADGSIISPISRIEYEIEWLGKSEDEITSDMVDSNALLLKWRYNSDISK